MIKIIQEFLQGATTQSIHVDEVVDEQLLGSKKNLWDYSLAFFNNIVAEIKSAQLTHIKVDLQVELNSDSNILVGPPEDEESLIDSVYIFGMPELIISRPIKELWCPKIELYTCPIFFDIDGLGQDIFIFYEEYRTIEEKQEGLEFTRWLTVSYLNDTITNTL